MVIPILQGPLSGTRWIAGSFTAGCWLGSYESVTQAALVDLLKPGDVFYDVGANVGFFTLLGSRLVGATGHVCAFEPIEENRAVLRRHLELNRISNVTVVPCAVWDSERTLRFQGTQATARVSSAGERTVNAVTLDDLHRRREMPLPAVIKLDVEGAELPALRGMTEVLRLAHPHMLIELHKANIDGADQDSLSLALLRDLGYTITSLANGEIQAVWTQRHHREKT